MAIIGTMFFNVASGSRLAGWSESVAILNATDLPSALTSLDQLAQIRKQLLGAGCSIPYLRVSVQPDPSGAGGVFRDSQVSTPNYQLTPVPAAKGPVGLIDTRGSGIYNADLVAEAAVVSTQADCRCDQPAIGLLVRAEGQSTNYTVRRSYVLRGLPDYVVNTAVDNPAQIKLATVWNGAYMDWTVAMLGGNYGMVSLDRTAANPPAPVASIDTTAKTPVWTFTGGPFATGDRWRISGNVLEVGGVSEYKGLNGVWTVATVSSGNVVTFLNQTGPVGATVEKLGSARKQAYITIKFTKLLQRRYTTHKAGSPFDPFHGRRRNPNQG